MPASPSADQDLTVAKAPQTDRPSAELLLGALKGPSLVVEEVAGGVTLRLSPLSPLQQRLLELWDLPPDLYQRLTLHCPEPPPSLSER